MNDKIDNIEVGKTYYTWDKSWSGYWLFKIKITKVTEKTIYYENLSSMGEPPKNLNYNTQIRIDNLNCLYLDIEKAKERLTNLYLSRIKFREEEIIGYNKRIEELKTIKHTNE